ncbi:hypothetical protein [Halobaculum sp. P14]|uniref:hypothetical protein n=1 Tax=Halobaculum sp. P14 TaxID=3421638 RepID=UPI003EBBBB99
MYVSHPVRRMRDDPDPDADVTLVVELDALDEASFRAAVDDAGGDVDAELRFDSYRVTLPETGVADLCALDGLATVETTNAVGYGGDAGEDVDGDDTFGGDRGGDDEREGARDGDSDGEEPTVDTQNRDG